MKPDEIIPGHVYEAKHPEPTRGSGKFYRPPPAPRLINDRMVTWVNSTRTRVQWEGPGMTNCGTSGITYMKYFLKWAGRDITAIMPEKAWREWEECPHPETKECETHIECASCGKVLLP